MTNAALRGDNMMWCMGDWLMPFLWEMLDNPREHYICPIYVIYANALDVPGIFFFTRVVCPAFLHQKK